jgi:hypothetical protein
MESEAEAALPGLLAELMTGGMGIDADTVETNPVQKHAATFQQWYQRLTQLEGNFRNLRGLREVMQAVGAPGEPRVPSQCGMLHSYYGQAIATQSGSARELAAAMAAGQMDRVTKQMGASRRTQELLNRSDAEFGAVCELYKVGQFYRIKVVPGETQLPSVLPR